MNTWQYVSILDKSLLQSLEKALVAPGEIIYVQDNNSKHTSKHAKEWFRDHDITVMPWPAYSPDMNPIEHI